MLRDREWPAPLVALLLQRRISAGAEKPVTVFRATEGRTRGSALPKGCGNRMARGPGAAAQGAGDTNEHLVESMLR